MLAERLTRIRETEEAIQRLSARVQGMMIMGQDREEVKIMSVALAREARLLAELCGDFAYRSQSE